MDFIAELGEVSDQTLWTIAFSLAIIAAEVIYLALIDHDH